ncbi:XRE family transcriptional regulator [Nakamurella silvestris]|nr:XRE family transcriptional regulator [Nakamurella silvestris]
MDEVGHLTESNIAGRIGGKVGSAIRLRRMALGMTMAELARLAGVSGPYISLLERGRSSISLETLYRVADALDTRPNFLLPESSKGRAATRRIVGEPGGRSAGRSVVPAITDDGTRLRTSKYCFDHEPDDPDVLEWHEHHGESFVYVLAGRLLLQYADGRTVDVGPGESVHSPAGSSHRCAVASLGRVELLVVRADRSDGEVDADIHAHPSSSST